MVSTVRRLSAVALLALPLAAPHGANARAPDPPPGSAPAGGKAAAPARPAAGTRPPTSAPASQPTSLEFPPAVAEHDVQRLRLAELRFDQEEPQLRIRFSSPRGEKRLTDLVAARLKERGALSPEVKRTLADGKPLEQLREILAATGTEFANRIEIRDDPRVFRVFRRNVLPKITDGCVRSGCHGGETARAMRLPVTARDQDGVAYSSFLVLDAVTVGGEPLLNRNDANRSILLDYLLPPGKSRREHPPVRGNSGRIPVLCPTEQHRDYIEIRDWIRSLKSPHPDYRLDYRYPAWLTPPRPVAATSQPVTSDAAKD